MYDSVHPLDNRWETWAKTHYRDAYPELIALFQQLLARSFLRCHWIPDPTALDYLTKILIRFLPVSADEEAIEEKLSLTETETEDPRPVIRFYESAGELILWWSGLYRKPLYRAEGKRSFEIAYEYLYDFEIPQRRFILLPGQEEKMESKRLKIDKMFSEQFENYQEILKNCDLINDAAYRRYRSLFMTDDFSIN